MSEFSFTPTADVRLILNTLLDKLEQRCKGGGTSSDTSTHRSIKVALNDLPLPAYFSQIDPEPRLLANEQLQILEDAKQLKLFWQPGEKGHLLESVTLITTAEASLYALLGRVSSLSLRHRLETLLLAERFRFTENNWHYQAIQHILAQLKQNKSPSPFTPTDSGFNEDLLTALVALSHLEEETPYRVFSVRVFNDSKRFEDLKRAIIRLARLGNPAWKKLPADGLLRELNLVANPTYLLLAGPWKLVNAEGDVISLAEFSPSIGLAAVQAMHLQRVNTNADKVICIENLTTFHLMAANLAKEQETQQTALLCLAGNPSPACRHLLKCLVTSLSENIPLQVWADLDYGGFNILAQLRKEITPRFAPFQMDIKTFNAFEQFSRPLSSSDRHHLKRLTNLAELKDVWPVIFYLLKQGLKLEQEAITLHQK